MFLHRPTFLGWLAVRVTMLIGIAIVALESVPAAGQESRVFATPQLTGQSPFRPSEFENLELPVALSGFSAVVLHRNQEWQMGTPHFQLIFDGQIYWFTSAREREIFAAAPLEYAPVLSGDCIVTFAEAGQRVQGQLQHGLLHAGRTYLFHSAEQLRRFQDNPSHYAESDLAHAGTCIVSQIDSGRELKGMPETTAMVNGLRYRFLGDYQRRLFASNMQRYGVQRQLLVPLKGNAPLASTSVTADPETKDVEAKQLNPDSEDEPNQPTFMIDGYCPVTFITRGVWVRGSYQFETEFHGKSYLFVSGKEQQQFDSDPSKFLPALGGDCLVSLVDEQTNVPGSVYYAVNDEGGKLYLFAGAEQREAFLADPGKYQKAEKKLTVASEEVAPDGDSSEQKPEADQ